MRTQVVGTHSNMIRDFAGMCRKLRAVTYVAALLKKALRVSRKRQP